MHNIVYYLFSDKIGNYNLLSYDLGSGNKSIIDEFTDASVVLNPDCMGKEIFSKLFYSKKQSSRIILHTRIEDRNLKLIA
ncbi:MAG: hypothetical protein WCO05_03350 [Candidatus Moraniibacteriota bacterium]